MRVLILCGSIRANISREKAVMELGSFKGSSSEFIDKAKSLIRDGIDLCNSEILSAAAMKGAIARGADIDYFPLVVLFHRRETAVFDITFPEGKENLFDDISLMDTLAIDNDKLSQLYVKIENADGVILSTPVYFGDRSSVGNKLLQITAKKRLLYNKIFGVISVGAKRNGGQETCIIYSLFEALNQNALVVGNGPPTAQYGGTAVGGRKGDVLDDTLGIETAYGVGTKVSHVSETYKKGEFLPDRINIRVDILITMDTEERFLANYIRGLTNRVRLFIPWVEFTIHEMIGSTIYRCIGCSICPVPSVTSKAAASCAIKDKDDYVENLRHYLKKSNCAIIAGLNILDYEKIIYRYQVLMERMRYIRRNDYELTDLLLAGLSYNQFGAMINPIHSIKTLTSYIRHNTTFFRSIEIFEYKGKLLNDGMDSIINLCYAARRMKAGRMKAPKPPSVYVAEGIGGYGDG